ncbi:gp54 [Streptococcus phage SFi18]|uniref:Uncharacterized protein n=2 Tax=Moineauvirus Sfi19 TaxID=72638 RepID=A0A3G8FAD1_9CAUD|nr:hypothetical protein Sfi19p24 [Streptococcus phage Sfi19]YP_010646064.1 hypothetical protein PP215_gp25 [Streptococcus phage CHPC919]AAD44064.1 orf54 gp [Streptococcus phage Sfi19]AAF63077.1 gp54 [Streptococcus phage SFi18]AZF90780.1 hypothetical protein CHPC919_0025 [Streptococcus phage CHPC919]
MYFLHSLTQKKKDRIEFFKLNKDEDAMKVYYNLADSGTIEKYLETSAFLEYINE